MYYIDRELNLNTGVKYDTYSIHIISSISVDFITNEISCTISSYKNWNDVSRNFIKAENVDACGNYFRCSYVYNSFDTDPNLHSLRILIDTKESPFYRSEIRRIYNDEEFLYSMLPVETEVIGENRYSEFSSENLVPPEFESVVPNLDGEFIIADVNVEKVVEGA